MKLETLKKDNKKKMAIGAITVISVMIVGVLASSFAKYQNTQSIPLVTGNINYKPYDMNVVAIYQEDENGEYQYSDNIPTNGYEFSNESYCETRNSDNSFVKDESIIVNYDMDTKTISATPITKQTKCYLYFNMIRDTEKPVVSKIETTSVTKTSIAIKVTATDNEGVIKYLYSINDGTYIEDTTNTYTFNNLTKGTTYTISVKVVDAAGNESTAKTLSVATESDPAKDIILAGITVKDPASNIFASVATNNGGIYKAQDNDGTSYYYRGAVTDNYLKFANKWWRIVRINGDGTIRIIYDGTAYHANGTSTTDSIAVTSTKFNSTANNAIYIGFKYGTTTEQRGLTNKSTILAALETWYSNNLASYANRIDTNAGFCGDRTAYMNTSGTTAGTGTGTNAQYFADYVRLVTNKAPVLTCANTNDLYTVSGAIKGNKSLTYPIGLINANEVSMAGGVYGTNNPSYYLYNGQYYWTMSPHIYDSSNGVVNGFVVGSNGNFSYGRAFSAFGVRPVINLRADVPITGSGTQNDPYVVNS